MRPSDFLLVQTLKHANNLAIGGGSRLLIEQRTAGGDRQPLTIVLSDNLEVII